MKRLLTALSIVFCSAVTARGETMSFDCQRYKSKCTAKACEELANGIREDSSKKILSLQGLESVEYVVNPRMAYENRRKAEDQSLAKRKYLVNYKFIEITPAMITLSNKAPSGIEKERVQIEPTSGFYRHYILHTDGSIKDVPIGEPYQAYFGWCNNTTGKTQENPAAVAPLPSFMPLEKK